MESVPKSSEKLHHFYTGLKETLEFFRRSIAPKVKEVENVDAGGFVRLRGIGEAGYASSQLFTRISRNDIVAGDRVLVGYLEDGTAVVLGKLLEAGEDDGLPPIPPGLRVRQLGGTVLDPVESLDFRSSTGLLATVDGGNPGEVDINFDLDFGDTRWLRRVVPYAPWGSGQSGRFFSMLTHGPIGALSGFTLTANRLYFSPIWVPESGTIDAVAFNVTTAVSGNVRVGIYSCNSSFLPEDRENQSSTTAISTTGAKVVSLAGAATVVGGRWYFASIVSTTAMAISGSTVAGALPALRGGADGSYGQEYRIMAQQDLGAGWGSLPDPAVPSSASANSFVFLAGRLA